MIDQRSQRAAQRIGQILRGKWRLDALLGIGTMGAVFAATHRNGKRVAVKMLHPEMSADPDVKSRFLREGYVANTIAHPGCVSIVDDDVSEDGAVFLVMEMLEGETLERRAERTGGRLPIDEVVELTAQLLDVLAAAHDKGVVHRDLKPENLFLTFEGKLKVLDFGIARLREQRVRATSTGSAMGTPAFMPPEQALAQWDTIDGRTDLWATGATMFTLLTGRLVHETESVTALLVAITTRPVAPLASVVRDVPKEVARVFDRALAMRQEDRWPDARAMQRALREAAASMPRDRFGALRPLAPSAGRAGAMSARAEANAERGSTMFTSSSTIAGLPKRAALPLLGAALLALGVTVALLATREGGPAPAASKAASALEIAAHPPAILETGAPAPSAPAAGESSAPAVPSMTAASSAAVAPGGQAVGAPGSKKPAQPTRPAPGKRPGEDALDQFN